MEALDWIESKSFLRDVEDNEDPKIEAKKRFSYRPEIDGLRSVAVIPVILYHFDICFSGGFAGVDVFFVISGFLISSIIMAELVSQKFVFKTFWERRVRRLFPAMFNLFFWLFIIGWFIFLMKDLVELSKQVFYVSLYVVNFYFYANTDSYWDAPENYIFLHFWSLAIEEQFYFIVPFCLFGIWKIFPDNWRNLMAFLFFGITCAMSLFISIVTSEKHTNFSYYLLPTRAFELSIGGILAVINFGEYMSWVNSFPSMVLRISCEITSWGGLLMIFYSYVAFDKTLAYPSYYALIPCLGTAFFIAGTTNIDNETIPSTRYIFSLKALVWVGSISYALYLWHWPIWVIGTYFSGTDVTFRLKVLFIIQSFAAAYFSTNYVEKYPRDKKSLPSRRLWVLFCSLWSIVVIFSGLLSYGHFLSDEITIVGNATNQTVSLEYDGYQLTKSFSALIEDDTTYTIESVSKSLPWSQSSYGVNKNTQEWPILNPSKDGSVCIVTMGSSYGVMYGPVYEEISNFHRVSMALMNVDGTAFRISEKKTAYDIARLDYLKKWKPKVIFLTDYWEYYHYKLDDIRSTMDSLLEVVEPGTRIILVGALPIIPHDIHGNGLVDFVKKTYRQTRNLTFLSYQKDVYLSQRTALEASFNQTFHDEYSGRNITFHPVWPLFTSKTGYIQIVGKETKGRMLYKDSFHLNADGIHRVKDYFATLMLQDIQC